MIVGGVNGRTAAILGVGLLLAGLWPNPPAADEPGPWATAPLSEAELAAHSGREGVLVIGEDQVVGVAKATGTIDNTTIGDIGSTGSVGDVTIQGGRGFFTVMNNTGANANMLNSTTFSVHFNNATNGP